MKNPSMSTAWFCIPIDVLNKHYNFNKLTELWVNTNVTFHMQRTHYSFVYISLNCELKLFHKIKKVLWSNFQIYILNSFIWWSIYYNNDSRFLPLLNFDKKCLLLFQEIASMLIAFERHNEWLSKEVKIR